MGFEGLFGGQPTGVPLGDVWPSLHRLQPLVTPQRSDCHSSCVVDVCRCPMSSSLLFKLIHIHAPVVLFCCSRTAALADFPRLGHSAPQIPAPGAELLFQCLWCF